MVVRQDSSDPTGVAAPVRSSAAGPGNPKATVARNRKADAAVSMRLAGATWQEIAATLGFPTPRQALVATERALARQLGTEQDREKMRQLAGARLERLLRAVWTKAIDPENPEQLVAFGRAREAIADHRKLFGLDAPSEVIVHSPTMGEIDAWVAQVLTLQGKEVQQFDVITGDVIRSDDAVSTG
jgi:hypothetical protein